MGSIGSSKSMDLDLPFFARGVTFSRFPFAADGYCFAPGLPFGVGTGTGTGGTLPFFPFLVGLSGSA